MLRQATRPNQVSSSEPVERGCSCGLAQVPRPWTAVAVAVLQCQADAFTKLMLWP